MSFNTPWVPMEKEEHERWADAIKAGDLNALLRLFEVRCSCGLDDWKSFQTAFLRAMRNATERDPASPARFLLNEILTFCHRADQNQPRRGDSKPASCWSL